MSHHNINRYFQSPSTHFANNFIRWHLVLSLGSRHHQAMIQEYEHIKVQESHNRPGVAQTVSGGLGFQIS